MATFTGSPRCIGCFRHPAQIPEYVDAAEDTGLSPDQYVREEEGTFNQINGHFTCTSCYIAMGEPSTPYGWVAP
jgi:hypothetical protein